MEPPALRSAQPVVVPPPPTPPLVGAQAKATAVGPLVAQADAAACVIRGVSTALQVLELATKYMASL